MYLITQIETAIASLHRQMPNQELKDIVMEITFAISKLKNALVKQNINLL